jgi:hypothetical protein
MKAIVRIPLLCVMLGAMVGAALADTAKLKPIKLTATQEQAVKAAVTYDLKDPDSAKFRPMVAGVAVGGTSIMVCGEVNSKNSFGGYVGFTSYLVQADSSREGEARMVSYGASTMEELTILKTCRDLGVLHKPI